MSDSSLTNETTGQINSVLGTAKQAVGSGITGVGLDGSAWTADGKEQHAKGEAEIKAAQAKGYAEGTADRVSGKIENVVGAVTGDSAQQAKGQAKADKGEIKQTLNNPTA